jgi:Protein of unknown function (DUF4232)
MRNSKGLRAVLLGGCCSISTFFVKARRKSSCNPSSSVFVLNLVRATSTSSYLQKLSFRVLMLPGILVLSSCTASSQTQASPTAIGSCRASYLTAKVSMEGAAGSIAGYIVYRAKKGRTCTLKGYAQVSLRTPSGRLLSARTFDMRRDLNGRLPQLVKVTYLGKAGTLLMWGEWCHQPIYAPLRLVATLPHGGGRLVPQWLPAGYRYEVSPGCYGTPSPTSSLSIGPFIRYPPTPNS